MPVFDFLARLLGLKGAERGSFAKSYERPSFDQDNSHFVPEDIDEFAERTEGNYDSVYDEETGLTLIKVYSEDEAHMYMCDENEDPDNFDVSF